MLKICLFYHDDMRLRRGDSTIGARTAFMMLSNNRVMPTLILDENM